MFSGGGVEGEDSEECVVTVRMSVRVYIYYVHMCVRGSVCSMCEREIMCMSICVSEGESVYISVFVSVFNPAYRFVCF